MTAREAASAFGLHPNVARTHLDTLASAGLVVTGQRKHAGGGRPAKVYVAREQADDVAATVPAASRLAVGVLAQAVRDLPDGERAVEDLAAAQGRRLVAATAGRATRRDLHAALLVALDALRRAFPEVRSREVNDDEVEVEGLDAGLRLVGEADAAVGDALARGLLRGALHAAGTAAIVTSSSGRVRISAQPATAPAAPAATLDSRGRTLQAGVVAAMRAVGQLLPGEQLEVITDVAGAPAAYARWADRAGHEVVDVARVRLVDGSKVVRLVLRRAR
ncbi:MAG TPA: hypothetical protein VGV67_11735 [Solirubrobacteraceae bacterium]|nr:hypothetical protein [Solirubrobacteraceae bacterium]